MGTGPGPGSLGRVDHAPRSAYREVVARTASPRGGRPPDVDLEVSTPEARRFLLAHQGLLPPRSLEGEAGALAYLRRHGPVGCRDWNTVFLLLSAGVDAFFTGCMTTTVATATVKE